MYTFMNFTWDWKYVCGPDGLRPWDDVTKDIGICFQELFLEIPVYFILAIVSAYYMGLRKDWVVREKTQERAITLRGLIVLGLVSVPIINLYIILSNDKDNLHPIDYFTEGAKCIAWIVHFGYVLALKHRLGHSSRGPLSQLVLWSIIVLFNVTALRSNILTGSPTAYDIASLCCHVLYFLTLLPASDSRPTFYSPCLVGSQHSHSEYTPLLPQIDEGVLGTAMQGLSYWSKLTFSWVDPLLQKGYENKLQDVEELYDIPTKYRCSYVGARMDRALIGNVDNYQEFVDVPHEPFIGSGYGAMDDTQESTSTAVTPTSRVLVRPSRRQNVSLFRALHSCFGVQFYGIGILKLVSDMAGFAGPILLNKLVTFVQDDSIDQHYGYVYSVSLLGASVVGALFNVHFNWLMSIIGIKIRGAIISIILRKTLSVTSTELNRAFSVGQITNFMSTDTDRIVNACPSFHALWSIPLQLAITLYLLFEQVGVSFLSGVAFSIILIPINKMIANKIGELSTEMMRHKDTRVSLMNDLLRGIRTIKLHVWEDYFIDKVTAARARELESLRGRKYLDAVCVVLWASTPVLVAALTMGTHALRGGALDAPTVFTTIALINMLISPLNAFPWVLNGLTEAWVSTKRIQLLLDLKDMNPEHYYDRLNTNRDEDKMIIMRNATFSWATPSVWKREPIKKKKNKGKSKKNLSKRLERTDSGSSLEGTAHEPFKLQDISLEIGKGELIGVVGPIGSGKTSLLLAIAGDMIKKSGDIQIPEHLNSFGYVSQHPWLIRGTIRDNIIFGKPYDEVKYRSVVDACALTEDLNSLGWNASVGSSGCTLSGGQRARVALARAVYHDLQVYLLDDVLCGVDAAVSAHIMSRCVLGLLRHRTRLLVTHAPRQLAQAHRVLLMRHGRVAALGPPETVLNEIEEFLPSETESIGEEPPPPREEEPSRDDQDAVSRNSLDEEEAMSEGSVDWWIIGLYLKSVGAFLTTAIVISLILMQLSQNFTFVWLTFWVRNKAKNSTNLLADNVHENTTLLDHGFNFADNIVHSIVNTTMAIINNLSGTNASTVPPPGTSLVEESQLMISSYSDNYYLEVYFGLAGLNLVFTVMRAFLFAYGGVKAAAKIHKILLKVIVKAKVKFFDITPPGRIINRFSSDTYTIDDSLPFIMNIFLAQVCSLIGAVAVTVYGLPWLLVGVLPMSFIYYRLQRRYRITSRQLRRLQSVAMSPVYVHFDDTLEGLSTVRALCGAGGAGGGRWALRGCEAAERWQRAALCGAAAQQWLALRLQAAAAAALAAAALLGALQRAAHAADPGLVGLAISYALSLTSMLSGVLNSFTETEREMIAVERVGDYITRVESEKVDGDPPPYGWPSHGVVAFEDVSLKYGTTGEALRDVSFSIGPCERVGVVGRTGAGKSSLLRAALRLTPCSAGRVRVDGVDVATLHLHALRSRIGVIPQEPFIFSGSILENVDPLRQYVVEEVWRALDACGARALVTSQGGLGAPALALSRGHRQVLCLARALLQKAKILLVDEATANLDQDSERTILDTIRCSFRGCTVVFVAHRVPGVLECARVLVLGGGRLLELRAPDDALADPASHLYRLLHPATDHTCL